MNINWSNCIVSDHSLVLDVEDDSEVTYDAQESSYYFPVTMDNAIYVNTPQVRSLILRTYLSVQN